MFKSKNTINKFTSVNTKISKKTKRILSKDIEKISLLEFAHLLREKIAVEFCISIIVSRLKTFKIDFEFFFNSNESEDKRAVLRELVLLNFQNWDLNPKAYNILKKILTDKITALKLPKYVNEQFLNYAPKSLVWNEDVIRKYSFFINDNITGVSYAYSLLIQLKRGVLNGTEINFNVKDRAFQITTLDDFEEHILKSVSINDKLRTRLDSEKAYVRI